MIGDLGAITSETYTQRLVFNLMRNYALIPRMLSNIHHDKYQMVHHYMAEKNDHNKREIDIYRPLTVPQWPESSIPNDENREASKIQHKGKICEKESSQHSNRLENSRDNARSDRHNRGGGFDRSLRTQYGGYYRGPGGNSRATGFNRSYGGRSDHGNDRVFRNPRNYQRNDNNEGNHRHHPYDTHSSRNARRYSTRRDSSPINETQRKPSDRDNDSK